MDNKTAILLDGEVIRVDKRVAAAAPDLLAALEMIMSYRNGQLPHLQIEDIYKNIRAAIAKARGE